MSNPFSPERSSIRTYGRHLRPIRDGLAGRDTRLKQKLDARSQERSAQAEHDRTEDAIAAAVHHLLQELQSLEQQTQIEKYTQQIQEAVGPLATSDGTLDPTHQRRFEMPKVPQVIERYIAVLLMLAMLTGLMTPPVSAQEGSQPTSPDTTTVAYVSSPETEQSAAPEYAVSTYMETTSMTTRILDKPAVSGTLLEQLGKYKAVGVLETNAGNGSFTKVVFLDSAGNLREGYAMEAFLGAPTPKGEESRTVLEQSLTQETEESQEAQEIRRVVVFASRQEIFENPEDLTSKTGEILSKGAHIATKQQEVNGISWVYIEGEGWIIKAVEQMDVVLGEDARDLSADEALTPEEEKIGKLDKKVTPTKDLNVRDIPGTEGSHVVGTATGGTEYVALEVDRESVPGSIWAKIELPDGNTGWIAIFSNNTQFSELIDPNPPEGMISDADRAELEKNLDTDWAKPEVKQQALKVAQAFDPSIAHAEFTTIEGQRNYHQLVFFDKDGNVLYQTAITGSGPEAVSELFEVDEDGSISPTKPVARATDTGWETVQDTETPAGTETLSSEEAEAATRALYPEELFTSIESQGGSYTYNAELGIYQAKMPDGKTYLLLPKTSANDPSKDAENAFFSYDAPDKQTISSSDGKVFITIAAEKDNFVTSANTKNRQPVEFNPKLLRRQDLIDKFIENYLHDYPESFRPGDGEPPVHFVLGMTDEDSEKWELRPGEIKELSIRGGIELRLLTTTRPDGGTSFVAALYLPLEWSKNNYIVNPDTGEQWEYERQKYLLFPFSRLFERAIAEGILYAYTGKMPNPPKTEEEKAAAAERAYGVQNELGDKEQIAILDFNLKRILTEYYQLQPQQ